MPLFPFSHEAGRETAMSNKERDEDFSDLPVRLRDLLATLPEYIDDKHAAQIVSQHCFVISPRTIEIWPVAGRYINGSVRRRTADLLREAWHRIAEAPVRPRGRRPVAVGGAGRGRRRALADESPRAPPP